MLLINVRFLYTESNIFFNILKKLFLYLHLLD